MPELKKPSRRIVELDLLRGFFIMVIILDHLQFWPSPFQYVTGQGRMWASAAEGFFIISGLLIGYLRIYKDSHVPMKIVAEKLVKRAGLLWIWCVIITGIVVLLSIVIPGNSSLLPKLPPAAVLESPVAFLWNSVSMSYANDWIYFLRLYAVMLTVSPLFIWLIRKKQALLAIAGSLGLYLASLLCGSTEMVFQWQVLFFGAACIGWKLEPILSWFDKRPLIKQTALYGLTAITIASLFVSYFFVHGWSYVESSQPIMSREAYVSIRAYLDPLFAISPLSFPRIVLSFIWFFGLLSLFHLLRKPIKNWLGWLLLTFGTASLTAYCLQAVILVIVTKLVQLDGNFWVNGLVSLLVVLLIWILMKIPLVRKVLPQ